MLPIQTALLFAAPPQFDLNQTAEALISHLTIAGYEADEISPAPGDNLRLRVHGLSVGIAALDRPLSADTFDGALDSPLSRRSKKPLQAIADTHSNHILITLDRIPGTQPGDPLEQLRIAHQVATFIASQTDANAVHWRQSNLLLSGKQFAALADQKTPWTLFASLQSTETRGQGDEPAKRGVVITNARDFLGAPVCLEPADISLDAGCAAALSFLRHAVQSETPLRDGQVFGSHPDLLFRLDITKSGDGHASGTFQLSVANGQSETVLDVPARPSGTTLFSAAPQPQTPAPGDLPQHPPEHEKTRSIAMSYLMLALAPPLGAFMLVTNLIFGVNAARTGLMALVAVAIGLIIGAYSFLNVGVEDSAILSNPEIIQTTPLDN